MSEDDCKTFLDEIKAEHNTARHHCYAWKLGLDDNHWRANDDGEPSNSAGKPIYGAILSAKITNVMIVVVRYFGGTKLGVGGLIDAYRTTAKMAIEDTQIVEQQIMDELIIQFPYAQMGSVMGLFKEHQLPVIDPVFEITCELKTSVRQSESTGLKHKLLEMSGVVVL